MQNSKRSLNPHIKYRVCGMVGRLTGNVGNIYVVGTKGTTVGRVKLIVGGLV